MPPELGGLRRRRQRRRREGPVQPGRRDLRRGALPQGGRRRDRPLPRDLRLQPRRLVRRVGAAAGARDRRHAGRPRRLADRPHAGPLPRRGARHVRRRARREGRHAAGRGRERRRAGRGRPVAPLDQRLREARRAGHRRQRRPRRPARQERAASAASSCCRTCTATATRTATSARSRASTRCRSRARQRGRACADELELPKADAKPTGAASAGAQPPAARAHEGRRGAPPRAATRRRDAAGRDEGAPVRASGTARPPTRAGGKRQLEELGQPLDELRRLLHQGARARPARLPAQAAAPWLVGDRRHDPRAHRQDATRARAARRVRDPPGRPRRSADRPEADPRRLEAARVDRDLPREGQERVLRPPTPSARRSARSC